MPSPSGIFLSLTIDELLALRASAILRVTQGDRTSLSGASKSSGKNFSMSAQDELIEINYAIQRLQNSQPPRSTHFNASGQSICYPGTISIP